MASTFELLQEAGRLVLALEDAGGELSDEMNAAILGWLESAEDKIGACFALQRRLAVEDQELETFEKRIKARRKALGLQRDRVNGYATSLLEQREQLGEEAKVKRAEFTCWLAITEKVDGPDKIEDWPEDLRRSTVVVEPDRTKAKELLKAGGQIPGLSLLKTAGIRWRVA